ncbi:MAG: UDP-3-O-acyl-N-acetylglucosamine deacetylase [Pirellulaceae bacterium]|nr:UDP-3-O-acyl-N-acetylglucosamine deacetylase [Pirellulaceae bacterium]
MSRPCEVAGFGYWSGRDVRVELRPAPPGTGLVFVRSDLDRPRRIPADVRQRIEVPRRTTLAGDGAQVEMVEHVLAALFGLAIDNCEIWVDAPEMPGLDGSSASLVAAIQEAGIAEQAPRRRRLVVTEVTRVGNDDSWVEARPNKTGGLSVLYKLDYGPNNPIGKQTIELPVVNPKTFAAELATARTFLMKDEADWLKSRGLGARVTSRDLLVFGPEGLEDNELRFENECVRHKALDLVGDLALAGCDLVGQFIAHKSGHRLNADLVKVLLTEGRIEEGLRRSA